MKILENIIGQPHIVTILESAVLASRKDNDSSQELTHSWLFTGPTGSGRSLVAQSFAAALVCSNGGCGKCIDCETAMNGSHLDIEIMKIDGLSIKVDEIRELISRSSFAPSVSNWRVIVLREVQRLTEAAANALLKAIEEPSSRTIWLLSATSITDVSPTLRSRCRHIQIRTPTEKSIVKLLIERDNIDLSIAEKIAKISQGNIGRANFLSKNLESRFRRDEVIDLILNLKDPSSAFSSASRLIELVNDEVELSTSTKDQQEMNNLQNSLQGIGRGLISGSSKVIKELERDQKNRANREIRDTLDRYLLDIYSIYRDAMLIKLGLPNQIINVEFFNRLQEFSEKLSPKSILDNMASIVSSLEGLTQNASNLLALENLLLVLMKS